MKTIINKLSAAVAGIALLAFCADTESASLATSMIYGSCFATLILAGYTFIRTAGPDTEADKL